MKVFFLILLILNFFTFSSKSEIAYIDLNLILNKSAVGDHLNKHIEKIKNKNINKFKEIEKQLIEKEKSLLIQKNIISEEEFNKKLNNLKKEVEKFRSNKKKYIDDLNNLRIENTKEILKILNPIITNYVNLNSISIVIPKKNIIVGKKNLDITSEITDLLNNEIQKLIRLAIAESNNNNNSSNFVLTPEGRLISSNFQSNKGRLPWPVREGIITRRFGTQPHPVVRTTTINSNGISIATSANSITYSVFEGEVLSVYGFSGGNPGVLIRHGKYISNYQNLSSIFVKKGDKVMANDEIGIVFTNESTGKTVLKFNIFNELKPENPTIWLAR